MNAIVKLLLALLLIVPAACTGPNQPLPKTPVALNLSPAERAVFRDGFRAGRGDVAQHLDPDHKRHPFPAGSEEAFRCGYIRGLTYDWLAFGRDERVRREYPAYADAYSRQFAL